MGKKSSYPLNLPEAMLEEVREVADKEQITMLQLLRSFIRLGLTYHRMLQQDPGTKLIVRQGEREETLLLL